VTNLFEEVTWAHIKVGNVIKVIKNEIVPADMLVIKSSDENGFCYLETSNLDGENALKPREAMFVTNSLLAEDDNVNQINGYIEVDTPNPLISRIEGTLFLDGYEKSYITIINCLLRGGRLKNVDYIVGVVLYSGKDTKLMQNIKYIFK
jgi:phospholipid-translocating ATPase